MGPHLWSSFTIKRSKQTSKASQTEDCLKGREVTVFLDTDGEDLVREETRTRQEQGMATGTVPREAEGNDRASAGWKIRASDLQEVLEDAGAPEACKGPLHTPLQPGGSLQEPELSWETALGIS